MTNILLSRNYVCFLCAKFELKVQEARKLNELELLSDGKITAAQAAERLNLSVRQVFRLKAKFQSKGAESLIHGNRGRKPVHTVAQEVRKSLPIRRKKSIGAQASSIK